MSNHRHEDRFPFQARAFEHAREIMASRNGAGFIFHVETNSGQVYSGPTASTEAVEVDPLGILTIEQGEGVVFIRNDAIASIRVEEC